MTWVLILYFYVWAGNGTTAAATTAVFQTEAACNEAGQQAMRMAPGDSRSRYSSL